MALTLRTLLRRLPPSWSTISTDRALSARTRVTGIAEDSRRVRRGTIFVAHKGRGTDGHRYIATALRAGAVGVIGELPRSELEALTESPVPYWQVEDGRRAFALLSAAFYNFPAHRMIIVGVTGTDGKTTTCTYAHSVLSAHGLRTGLITTIAARIDDQELDTGFHTTTPEAFDLQGYLARMEQAGCQAVVLETTSHALDQERVAYIDYDVAIITNVTHEHLDWHGTWEHYMEAKARLFDALSTSRHKPGILKTAVLNVEDRSYPILQTIPAERTITYAINPDAGAMVTARDIAVHADGTQFHLVTPIGEAHLQLALIGVQNVANALAACAVGLSVGASLNEIVAGLQTVRQVRGRMEFVHRGKFGVIIDFAHTPNALARTIATARVLLGPTGRVIVVFGSAGLRDIQKRRLMGEVACQADVAVLTAEDPRTEDVNAIIEEIASGLIDGGKEEGTDFLKVPDRSEAIDTAIGLARPGDLVICCGKAHERSMAFGTVETPWNEFAAVEAALIRHHIARAY
jgi:UDP-N-acetylmuramoyl-L-alanyl-D-glutamate--2,6-diaminopimelate ligase